VLTITKALTKTTNCTCRAKKVDKHEKNAGVSRRMCAPTLSNSFRRHWPTVH